MKLVSLPFLVFAGHVCGFPDGRGSTKYVPYERHSRNDGEHSYGLAESAFVQADAGQQGNDGELPNESEVKQDANGVFLMELDSAGRGDLGLDTETNVHQLQYDSESDPSDDEEDDDDDVDDGVGESAKLILNENKRVVLATPQADDDSNNSARDTDKGSSQLAMDAKSGNNWAKNSDGVISSGGVMSRNQKLTLTQNGKNKKAVDDFKVNSGGVMSDGSLTGPKKPLTKLSEPEQNKPGTKIKQNSKGVRSVRTRSSRKSKRRANEAPEPLVEISVGDTVVAKTAYRERNRLFAKRMVGTVEKLLENDAGYEFKSNVLGQKKYAQIFRHLQKWQADNTEEGRHWEGIEDNSFCIHLTRDDLDLAVVSGEDVEYEIQYADLGVGAFGAVHKGVKKDQAEDGKFYAIKEMTRFMAKNKTRHDIFFQNLAEQEVKLLQSLAHKNIIGYIDHFVCRAKFYMVMELAHGDLDSLIQQQSRKKEYWKIEKVTDWFGQILSAVEHFHSAESASNGDVILHRDLKPENILTVFTSDAQIQMKISDLGLARPLKKNKSYARSCVGTPVYMSPEAHNSPNAKYSTPNDIWALGCILFEMCTLKRLFNGMKEVFGILKGEPILTIATKMGPRANSDRWTQLSQVCAGIFCVNPDDRPTCKKLVNQMNGLKKFDPRPRKIFCDQCQCRLLEGEPKCSCGHAIVPVQAIPVCPKCNEKLRENAKFCDQCTQKVPTRAKCCAITANKRRCGQLLPPNARFCRACGQPVATAEQIEELKEAVRVGNFETVKKFIGLNIDVQSIVMDEYEQNNLLHSASERGHAAIVQALVREFNADGRAKANGGVTPLHLASREGHIEVVSVLVNETKARADALNNKGNTPLHLAAEFNRIEVVKILVRCLTKRSNDHRARIAVKNDLGQAAQDYARQKGYDEISDLLFRAWCGLSPIEVHDHATMYPQVAQLMCFPAGNVTADKDATLYPQVAQFVEKYGPLTLSRPQKKSTETKNLVHLVQNFRVIVPDGVKPGDAFKVTARGTVITLKCPENSKAGEQVEFQLPVEHAPETQHLKNDDNQPAPALENFQQGDYVETHGHGGCEWLNGIRGELMEKHVGHSWKVRLDPDQSLSEEQLAFCTNLDTPYQAIFRESNLRGHRTSQPAPEPVQSTIADMTVYDAHLNRNDDNVLSIETIAAPAQNYQYVNRRNDGVISIGGDVINSIGPARSLRDFAADTSIGYGNIIETHHQEFDVAHRKKYQMELNDDGVISINPEASIIGSWNDKPRSWDKAPGGSAVAESHMRIDSGGQISIAAPAAVARDADMRINTRGWLSINTMDPGMYANFSSSGGGAKARKSSRPAWFEPKIVGDRKRYILEKVIGSGAFGVVYKGRPESSSSNKTFALKEMKNQNQRAFQMSVQEAELLRSLKHPNVIEIFDTFTYEKNFYMVMEFMNGEDLYGLISSRKKLTRDENRVWDNLFVADCFTQIVSGVDYLHCNSILHRDLKPQNILISEAMSGNAVYKVSDFGLSKRMKHKDLAKTFCGTQVYMSPEQNDAKGGSGYSFPSDVWALGCILFELCAWRRAFLQVGDVFIGKVPRIVDTVPVNSPHKANHWKDLSKICVSLLEQEPANRPVSRELLRQLKQLKQKANPSQGRGFNLFGFFRPRPSVPNAEISQPATTISRATRRSSAQPSNFEPGDSIRLCNFRDPVYNHLSATLLSADTNRANSWLVKVHSHGKFDTLSSKAKKSLVRSSQEKARKKGEIVLSLPAKMIRMDECHASHGFNFSSSSSQSEEDILKPPSGHEEEIDYFEIGDEVEFQFGRRQHRQFLVKGTAKLHRLFNGERGVISKIQDNGWFHIKVLKIEEGASDVNDDDTVVQMPSMAVVIEHANATGSSSTGSQEFITVVDVSADDLELVWKNDMNNAARGVVDKPFDPNSPIEKGDRVRLDNVDPHSSAAQFTLTVKGRPYVIDFGTRAKVVFVDQRLGLGTNLPKLYTVQLEGVYQVINLPTGDTTQVLVSAALPLSDSQVGYKVVKIPPVDREQTILVRHDNDVVSVYGNENEASVYSVGMEM